jgi:hypothetical protein
MAFKSGTDNARWQGNKGSNNPSWGKKRPWLSERNRRGKGLTGPLARYFNKNTGYVTLLRPIFPGHEKYARNKKNGNWQVPEHVVVMARHLGRPIKKGETIHHRNGIRHYNQISNLELWSKSHPAGQRVLDVYNWAKSYIAEYEKDIDFL